MSTVIVTGGAGFIGSAVVRQLVDEGQHRVVNVDCLTYAANLESLGAAARSDRYVFEQVDICNGDEVARLFREHRPAAVMHLAAESHVDRSIDGPGAFIQTNIVGTYTLLQHALGYFRILDEAERSAFRFHHVSTDEVFGSLGKDGLFAEDSPYQPSSPYSASKASADHLVRAWHHTFGLPVVLSNCSNNYGPCQFPEKLIPLMVLKGLAGEALPVYGKGDNVRDWLYVEDHAEALRSILRNGAPGRSYNVGGNSERTNLQVVHAICDILDEIRPAQKPRRELIHFVADRPGHDLRYAIDATRIANELGWRPRQSFESGLRETVQWYLDNESWWRRIQDGSYRGERLGLEEKGRG